MAVSGRQHRKHATMLGMSELGFERNGRPIQKLTMTQLDGGRGKAPPGMTDESSEEEEERDEEEDPTLSAIKYGLEEEEQQQKEGEVKGGRRGWGRRKS